MARKSGLLNPSLSFWSGSTSGFEAVGITLNVSLGLDEGSALPPADDTPYGYEVGHACDDHENVEELMVGEDPGDQSGPASDEHAHPPEVDDAAKDHQETGGRVE